MILKKLIYKFLKYFFALKTIFSIYIGYLKMFKENDTELINNYPWFVIITDILFFVMYIILVFKLGYYSSAVKVEEWMFDEWVDKKIPSPLTISITYIALMYLCYLFGDCITWSYIIGTIIFTTTWFQSPHIRNVFKREYRNMMNA